MNLKPLNLYIHLPFCAKKCHYCAFYSSANSYNLINPYSKAIQKEISQKSHELSDYELRTIYFGGGTPSLVAPEIIKVILKNCTFKNVEVTLEANPDSLTREKLSVYYDVGVNRLSIGLQAWQDHLLESMGRIHTVETFLQAYEDARRAGFKNINVDLMFGLPNQTLEVWQETLDRVVDLNPEHISCYSLELDNHSLWGALHAQNRLDIPIEDIDRKMNQTAVKTLSKAGYHQYEISNFAKKGYACQHNLDFWNHQEYIGIGAGAHSYIDHTHLHHEENLRAYITDPLKLIKDLSLSPSDEKIEWLIKRLRLTKGFTKKEYSDIFKTDICRDFKPQVDKLEKLSLLEMKNNSIVATPKGLDLYNQLILTLQSSC